MPQIDMVLIPEPAPNTRSILVLDADAEGPVIEGGGNVTFRCGRCKRILADKVGLQMLQSIVLKCPKCASYNELPPFTQR